MENPAVALDLGLSLELENTGRIRGESLEIYNLSAWPLEMAF